MHKPAPTPFFATKTTQTIVVKTGVRAGAAEQTTKLREQEVK